MNASDIKLSVTQQTNLGDGYLQFKLNESSTAVFLVNLIQEVVVLSNDLITQVPNISELFLGLMNWHNRAIWVVDLPRILGLESYYQLRQCNIIVIRHKAEAIGLMVPEVKGTVRFNSDNIQSASERVASNVLPYLEGCLWHGNELNLVLDIQAILESLFTQEK